MTTAADNVVALIGNPLIDGLTWGAAWQFGGGAHVLTYSLSLNDTPGNQPAWTTSLSNAARLALAQWSNVANLSFVEIGGGEVYYQSPADLAFLLTGNEMQAAGLVGLGIAPSPSLVDSLFAAGGATRADYPQPEGDIALDSYYSGFSYLSAGGVGLTIMLHEIGHALGLKHTNNGPDARPTFASLGIANLDSQRYTVMSYTDAQGQQLGSNQSTGNAATPMPLDILTMQHIYGANTGYHTGDDIYTINPLGASLSISTIWDAAGNDTIAVRTGSTGAATLDLREGQDSDIGGYKLAVAYNAIIENATGGSDNDRLTGNAAANRLDGGGGGDSMSGGEGNDTYIVDSSIDLVTELSGEGIDTIISSIGLTAAQHVENLILSGSSGIHAYGNELDNNLTGNSADNFLDGRAGSDTMIGGGGNDTLAGGSGSDVLDGGAGFDIAQYSGNRGDYTIAQGAWYHYTITVNDPADGDDGVDAVSGVEQLQFADSIESLQTSASWHGFKHRPITPFWAGTDWQVLDSRHDFDGNGKNDLLLHKPDGSVALWLMNGAERIAGAIFEPSPGRTLIDATTDYNGDGKTDLGWREADNSNSHWLMGSGWVESRSTSAVAPPVTPPAPPPPIEFPPSPPTLPPPPTVPTAEVSMPPLPDGWLY